MARMISSASARSCSRMIVSSDVRLWARRPQVESDQHPFAARQVADDLAQRLRHLAYQRRDGENLVVARELRVLEQVDHVDPVAPRQVVFAERVQVAYRRQALRRL